MNMSELSPLPAPGTIEAFVLDLLAAGARLTLTSPIKVLDGWPPCAFIAFSKRRAAGMFLDWIWIWDCECAAWGMDA